MLNKWFALMLLLSSLSAAAANQSISPSTYEALNDIQTLLQEENFAEARASLQELEDDLKPGLGLALVHQLYGQFYLMQENNPAALQQFIEALNLEAFAPAQQATLATNVAQLYLAQEQAGKAVEVLQPRLEALLQTEQQQKDEEKKTLIQPMAFATLAMAHHINKHYSAVIQWMPLALERAEKPRENWLQVLAVAHYERKQYQLAAQALQQLIALKPENEDYWVQQASMYQLLDKPALSLRALETGYAGGYLSKGNNILLVVQLLINQGVPERAARILQRHLNDGTLELSDNNWKLLAAAWQQGRERQDAVQALRKASESLDDGGLLLRAARLSLQDNQHQQALRDIKAALKKGLPDKQKGDAYMLAGSSAYELKDYPTAKRYFQRALQEAKVAGSAKTWLNYIESVEEYL